MSISVKSLENQELSCVISMLYRGYAIVLHHDPSMYSYCEILDPNGRVLSGIRFSCSIEGVEKSRRVVDALLD